jgi:hypothetical protein
MGELLDAKGDIIPGELLALLAEEIQKEINAEILKMIQPIVVRMWLQ